MTGRIHLDLAALCCVLIACEAPANPPAPFVLVLHAQTATGAPVVGARFWADGRVLGTTPEDGALRAELPLPDGSSVGLTVACPPAFRTETPERRLSLVRGIGSSRAADAELSVRCAPIEPVAALVVLVRGQGSSVLPIRVGGELVGQTEVDGTAHLRLRAPARSTLRVELDTEARPDLQPQHPVHSFRLGEEDSILLVEQAFEPERRRPSRARPALPSSPRRPERIR